MTEGNIYDEKQLLLQLAEGDETAFRQLFDLYKVRLFAFVLELTHSRADTEEIVQETFLKIWEHRALLSNVSYPRKYIYTIARNKTLDWLSGVARNQQLINQVWANLSQAENPVEEILQVRESHRQIEEAVAQLSSKKQTIFRMSRREGMPHEEIADQLGLSKSTVKNTIVEVLKHIKHYLATHSRLLSVFIKLL